VNISDNMRKVVLNQLQSDLTAEVLPVVFNPPETEVRKMLNQGTYVIQFVAQQSQNIDHNEVRNRYIIGSVSIALAVALFLILWLALKTSPWIEFVLLLPLLFGGSYLGSAQAKT